MPLRSGRTDPIYHLALRDEWQRALDSGVDYRQSTLGKSLEDEGFIHCSYAHQVQLIADLVYGGRDDVILLVIDPARLRAEVRSENLEGGDQLFPHVYGSLPLEAVVAANKVSVDAAGRLSVDV